MHLESRIEQRIAIPSIRLDVTLTAGETIRTELSHKYTRDSAVGLLESAGIEAEGWWTDRSDRFALALARRRG